MIKRVYFYKVSYTTDTGELAHAFGTVPVRSFFSKIDDVFEWVKKDTARSLTDELGYLVGKNNIVINALNRV